MTLKETAKAAVLYSQEFDDSGMIILNAEKGIAFREGVDWCLEQLNKKVVQEVEVLTETNTEKSKYYAKQLMAFIDKFMPKSTISIGNNQNNQEDERD